MFDPDTSFEDSSHPIIKILALPGVLKWLFNDIHSFAQQSGAEMNRFPELITTISRYYNFSQTLLDAVVNDSLTGLNGSEFMFREDHMRIRVLRESIAQSHGSTLVSRLGRLVQTLATLPLCEADLSQTGNPAPVSESYRGQYRSNSLIENASAYRSFSVCATCSH